MAKGVAHAGKDKDLSSGNAIENERLGWDEETYRRKNQKPTNNYDWSRHGLNFEIVDGRIMPLGSQKTSLYNRYLNVLRDLNFKEYKVGATNKQNTYVELILSGSTDRMQQLAFGDQKVDYERNPKNWHNWHVRREKAIEEWALDTYRFVCKRYGRESIIGFEVHLDETEPHAHVNIVPTAVMKQRGNVGGYVKVDANGTPITYTKGKHIGEVIKLSKGKYDALSDEKKKEYRPAVRGQVRTISYATHFGSTLEEQSRKMSELHDEYHKYVGAKWGLQRGDVWKDLPEEERRKRRRRTKEEAYAEKRAREAKEKAIEEASKMANATLFDRLFHSGLSKDVRKSFEEKDEAHRKELKQATMATYSDGSPVKWEGGGQLTWNEFANYLEKQNQDNIKRLKAEKEAAVANAIETTESKYKEILQAQLKSQKEINDRKIERIMGEYEKALLAFDAEGQPIRNKLGQQMTKDEQIKELVRYIDQYKNTYRYIDESMKLAKDLFWASLDMDLRKIAQSILNLLKKGVTVFVKELVDLLQMSINTMDSLERRKEHIDKAFRYARIVAHIDRLELREEKIEALHEDAMRIADGTWESFHKSKDEPNKQEKVVVRKIKR